MRPVGFRFGQEQTLRPALAMSAIPPNSGQTQVRSVCPRQIALQQILRLFDHLVGVAPGAVSKQGGRESGRSAYQM